MSNHRSADEARQHHMTVMGPELGTTYSALWQEIAWLYKKWAEYIELFGTKPSRVDLLNRSAPTFFRIVQDALWEETLLSIARLTDPPKSAGKATLTIRRMPTLVEAESLRVVLEKSVDVAINAADFARDWRNRRIAHRDLRLAVEEGIEPLKPASREKVTAALSALAAVLNHISGHYLESETFFDALASIGGAAQLLYVLDDGLKVAAERRVRLERGDLRPDDWTVRNL